jgi:hypothetical protein
MMPGPSSRRFPSPLQVEQTPGSAFDFYQCPIDGGDGRWEKKSSHADRRSAMFKKLLLTAIVVGLVSTFSLQIAPAEAANVRGMTCKEAAKLKYPDDGKTRRTWRKLCRTNWKQHQGG